MKVVYAGLHYGTCLSRFHGLQKLADGAEFFPIDGHFSSFSSPHSILI